MKKLYIFLLLIILAVGTVSAQLDAVKIKVEDLTQSQLEQIKREKEKTPDLTTVETAGKYIGLGKEIGQAINEGLNSTIDAANKFGNTKVGTFTMQILAWKLLGKDLVRVALAILLLLVSIWITIYNLRKFSDHKVRIEGAWYQFWITATYQVIKANTDESFWYKFGIVVLFLVSIGVAYGILP